MGAIFSEDRVYRYTLYRRWWMPEGEQRQGPVAFIGLNPSTADETNDDPTIRRCRGFAQSWGFGEMYMLNLFAFRATKPKDLFLAADPVGPDNDRWLKEISGMGAMMVAAWGRHGKHLGRDRVVLKLLGKIKQIGDAEYPRHPLYLKKNLFPVELQRAGG